MINYLQYFREKKFTVDQLKSDKYKAVISVYAEDGISHKEENKDESIEEKKPNLTFEIRLFQKQKDSKFVVAEFKKIMGDFKDFTEVYDMIDHEFF